MLKQFRVPIILSVVAVVMTFFFGGLAAAITVLILGVLEISLSFDNAIVNAKILGRMDEKWQKIFLTWGILIAVFGMRLLFPLIVVAVATSLGPVEALALAINDPVKYGEIIHAAHPAIAAFGGVFLLMLFLDWLFDEKEIRWLAPVEATLEKAGKLPNISTIIALVLISVSSVVFGHTETVLFAGLTGLLAYLLVSSIDTFFNEDLVEATAKAGFATFMYLEVLDASFSFDGVVGAFAVTNNIFLIALGLGIGAMFIRGMTVYLTNKGTLSEYIYLEHGAHWAIGVLALMLLVTIKYEISDIIIGLSGVGLIALAFANSINKNKKEQQNERNTRKQVSSSRQSTISS